LPPHTTGRRVIETYLRHMCEKVAARLRRHELQPGRLYVGLRRFEGDVHAVFELPYGPPEGRRFFELARVLLKEQWRGEAVTHVQVTATHLRTASGQLDLFAEVTPEATRSQTMDRINDKYGEFTLAPATLLERSSMPNVIAPAWRPHGHRQTIPD
jgi:DNA polymerase-4